MACTDFRPRLDSPSRMTPRLRIVLGILIAPIVYALALQHPYSEFRFQKWLRFDFFTAYAAFLLFFGVSWLVLSLGSWRRFWQACAVVFGVTVLFVFPSAVFGMGGYESLNVPHPGLVEGGRITRAGYMQCATDALMSGAVSVVAMTVYWMIAMKGQAVDSRVESGSR